MGVVVNDMNAVLANNRESMNYLPNIYVARNIMFDKDQAEKNKDGYIKFFYKNIKTIYGEKLPEFPNAPILNIQGNRSEFSIIEKTSEYFTVNLTTYSLEREIGQNSYDLWIVAPN